MAQVRALSFCNFTLVFFTVHHPRAVKGLTSCWWRSGFCFGAGWGAVNGRSAVDGGAGAVVEGEGGVVKTRASALVPGKPVREGVCGVGGGRPLRHVHDSLHTRRRSIHNRSGTGKK